MKIQDLAQFNLPDSPGVYFFYGPKKKLLYVGKATSLKDRVKSYFSKDIFLSRGPRIVKMLEEAERVEFMQTDSVLEALILEANQIKKYQPPANSREKDDKSYNYVVITKEDFPRIILKRGRELIKENTMIYHSVFGPFPHAGELREALKIVRKIFPFRDEKCKLTPKLKPCFNAQLGLCPGPCAGRISKTEYRKLVRKIKLFFEGRKPELIGVLEREMNALAKKQEFEAADNLKRQLFALDHIQDIALIKRDLTTDDRQPTAFRIEAFDIAHLSGKDVVGVMTVVRDGELDKSQYRKFKIKADNHPSRKASEWQGNDDTNNLKEVLERRLNHPEWAMPDLIVVDGGLGQLNTAKMVLKERGVDIDVVSVVKDERHKPRTILGNPQITNDKSQMNAILKANSEAHRFAIGYHRKLRSKGFRI